MYDWNPDDTIRWLNEERAAIQLGLTDAKREELERKRKEAEESAELNE